MNVENKSVYRQSSLDRIQSPEQLNSYLRVTNPSAWTADPWRSKAAKKAEPS